MKTILYSFFFAIGLLFYTNASAQEPGVDSTGLPGDNFSLQGALQLFKDASSPEEFEKLVNTESNHVNNLDLNEDGDIDYVRVIDQTDQDAHAFVLQVPVSESESQDIAVIELEKTGESSAIIQIIGDEEIYGEQVIVEPAGDEKSSGGKGGFMEDNFSTIDEAIIVNVWLWPSVRFVYAPGYRPWISPWRWSYYPTWWRPWRPLRWHVWHPYHRSHHRSFVVVHTHRVTRAHRVYTPVRTSSITVRKRHSTAVGNFKVKRTTTTVKGPRGNTTKIRKTTVKSPRGNVKVSKTTVKRRRG